MNKINFNLTNTERVVKVYNGKRGRCCCGCAGKYTYTSNHKDQAEKNFGKVNDRVVKQHLAKMKAAIENNHPEDNMELTIDDDYVCVESGDKMLIVHFK